MRELFPREANFLRAGRSAGTLLPPEPVVFNFRSVKGTSEQFDAISKAQAVIRFDASGKVVEANENFLRTMGYRAEEIIGKHHRIFCDPAYADSPAYAEFWNNLRAGRIQAGEFERFRKDGSLVTLAATYSPMQDGAGFVKTAIEVPSRRAERRRTEALLATLDDLPIAVMTCDPATFVIDYANTTSKTLLRRLEAHLPISADQLIGSSIDVFHKRPMHQREIVGRGVPHHARIRVGPEYLDLRISHVAGRPLLIWSIVTEKAEMAEELSATVEGLEEVAKRVAAAAEKLVSTASQLNAMASTVSAAGEEQAAAIAEVAQRTSETAVQAGEVGEATTATREQLRELVTAVGSIGEVLDVVNSIAAQTKLLALNATIEAARAGEMGKGFAVVAAEVKALADQTAKSTGDITQRIGRIQSEATRTSQSVTTTIDGVQRIAGISSAVAAATDEQRAVATDVAATIVRVADEAAATRSAAEVVASLSEEVNRFASGLEARVRKMLAD
nr:PAS domain-containing methyl-accepting chemotaxis protein [Oharaeibacter diazotrophicus]